MACHLLQNYFLQWVIAIDCFYKTNSVFYGINSVFYGINSVFYGINSVFCTTKSVFSLNRLRFLFRADSITLQNRIGFC